MNAERTTSSKVLSEGYKGIIKVCGMRDANNIREIENLGVDWLGFIFIENRRDL